MSTILKPDIKEGILYTQTYTLQKIIYFFSHKFISFDVYDF